MARQTYVLILDFGSQYTQLIARRVREANIYSEIHPFDWGLSNILTDRPAAIILSGGPASVYDSESPQLDPQLLELGIPVLGICYGFQAIARVMGGTVEPAPPRERGYGRSHLTWVDPDSVLLHGLTEGAQVWTSHGDVVMGLPGGMAPCAHAEDAGIAAFEDLEHNIFGVQFHPEVAHTPRGAVILNNFLREIAKISRDWTVASFVESTVADVRERVGGAHVVAALSGGVDSSVMVALLQRAIGNQLHPIFVDNGLLRKNEAKEILETFSTLGVPVHHVDATDRFLDKLAGVTDPEVKRKIIGKEFIRVFEEEARKIPCVDFLAQGTLYPDVIESVSFKGGPSVTIKSHHNVGGLPERMHLKLLEPLRELFKDEVRELGQNLGVPDHIVWRHPFPGPGLAVRILGEVTRKRTRLLREADAIAMEEIRNADLYRSIWQAFVVLLPVRSVGVMGDGRTYEHVAALRAVDATDGMTADWSRIPYEVMATISNRIINEVRGINRVVYDISSKPPATIEWE